MPQSATETKPTTDAIRAEAWRRYMGGNSAETDAQKQAAAIFASGAEWQASRVAKIESQAELDALPVGSLIEVAFHEHAESTQILRVNDNGASAGNASLRGGKFWSEVWGWAESITVLYRPEARS